ncbi:LANO_0F00562g1_1 [Lachancea nothofagi CBS 11611]|uniref:LANO_0F00562g1_1 n=1 Tax=Lachancea nothofagi CBS 11611 TaxID=1266666 RepID=A0A1G4K5E2_9SACH|nr:LANO_0F00562g1_1 [Lachancea nothofagi CBS 11611]
MVSLTKAFLSAFCLAGTAFAKYSNASSTSVTAVPKTTPTAFFSTVHLIDSYTGTNVSNDKEHWFMVQAELYVSAEFDGELYLTAPQQLQNFPQGSFDLLQNEISVGSVSYNSSNVFTIKPKLSSEDRSATFNVLATLSDDFKNSISNPETFDFEFQTAPGSIVEKISFVAQDLSASQTNARVDEHNKITYTVNIPLSEYPGAFNFAASFSASEAYEFDTSLTMVQVVVDTDAFNQPTKAINLTAVRDTSDESSINLSLESRISGGKSILITYVTTSILDAIAVDTVATLNYPTLSSYKRDISIMFEDHVVLKTSANLNNFGEEVNVYTGSGFFPTVTAINSTTASSNTVPTNGTSTFFTITSTTNGTGGEVTPVPANGSTTVSVSPSLVSSSLSSNSSVINSSKSAPANGTSIDSVTSASNFSTTLITPAPVKNESVSNNGSYTSNSNGAVLTYTVVTRTSNGQYEVYTSFFPVATLSAQSPASVSKSVSETYYIVNSTVSSTNAIPTQTVFTRVISGEIVVYTSLVPVATLNSSISSQSSLSTSKKVQSTQNSSSTQHSNKSNSSGVQSEELSKHQSQLHVSPTNPSSASNMKPSKTTEYYTSEYITSKVLTTTSNGRVLEYTSWFPVTTVSSTISSLNLFETASSSTPSPSLSASQLSNIRKLTASVVTKTKGGKVSIFTTMVSVGTELTSSTSLSQTFSVAPITSQTNAIGKPHSLTIVVDTAQSTQVSSSSRTGVSAKTSQSVQEQLISTSLSYIGASSFADASASRTTLTSVSKSTALATRISADILQSTQDAVISTSLIPIGASSQYSAAGGQASTAVSLTSNSMSGQSHVSSNQESTGSSSTLSGLADVSLQTQTALSTASSTPFISTFDGAAYRLQSGMMSIVIGVFACLL